VIFGTGGIAEVAHFYLEHDSPDDVVAFTVHRARLEEPEYRGLPLVPFEEVEDSYPPGEYVMYVAIGYTRVNTLRAQIVNEAKAKGYELITYISSKATYWGEEIGENCFIFEDNTIQPFVKIGDNVTMWSGNHIGHSAEIGDHCFISSHVVVSGYTKIGAYSFLGVNSTLRDAISIGESNVIGAGAIIMRDTQDHEVYVPERTKVFPRRSDEIDF
jgi:sugar O-acyltransferase (sialic acid O-acetyltransferase NeuD family)